MNYIKRQGAQLCSKVDVYKAQFLFDVQSLIKTEAIFGSVIINWNQITIKFLLMSLWTIAHKGSKHVKISGAYNKRQNHFSMFYYIIMVFYLCTTRLLSSAFLVCIFLMTLL